MKMFNQKFDHQQKNENMYNNIKLYIIYTGIRMFLVFFVVKKKINKKE